MSEYLHVGPIQQELAPHPLQPEGHRFKDTDLLLVTEWGDVLPPVEFSLQQIERVQNIETSLPIETNVPISLFDHQIADRVVILATYLAPKLTFDENTGCWRLPLKAETDEKNRARYPCVTVKKLGYDNQLAHRATVETFMGIPLPRGERPPTNVDHRCRVHACCNPYHLEAVTSGENNRRKEIARKRATMPELFQIPHDTVMTFGELAVLTSMTK